MATQPTRKTSSSPIKKKVRRKPTKEEVIRRNIARSKKPHPQYGSSKLEDKFAQEFLDKLGVKYVRQFEAKDIKRFYDFYLPEHRILLEVDGDFYHSYGKVYEEMNPMQKKNHRVDKIKDEWALTHGIPLLRIWEHDIRQNPNKVLKMLMEALDIADKKAYIKENKRKRH